MVRFGRGTLVKSEVKVSPAAHEGEAGFASDYTYAVLLLMSHGGFPPVTKEALRQSGGQVESPR
jgi:hypothetical protein